MVKYALDSNWIETYTGTAGPFIGTSKASNRVSISSH